MDRKNLGKLIGLMGIIASCVLLIVFGLTISGVVDLSVVTDFEVNAVAQWWFSVISYMLNIYLMISIITTAKTRYNILATAIYIPLYIIGNMIGGNVFTSTILPFGYGVIAGKIISKEKWTYHLKRAGVLLVYVVIVQMMLMNVRTEVYNISYNYFDNVLLLVISGDFLVKLFLYYMGVKLDVQLDTDAINRVLSRKPGDEAHHRREENSKDVEQVKQLSKIELRIFIVLTLLYQLINIAIVIFLGLRFNIAWEMAIFLSIFFIGRKVLGGSWHSKSMVVCLFVTLFTFTIISATMIPLSFSLFYSIIISGLFVCVMHLASKKEDGVIGRN